MARLASASLALLSFLRSPLVAQELSGRLEGQIVGQAESKANAAATTRATSGATIEATRVQPEPAVRFEIPADERGRYRFDTLPPGEYALHVSTPLLDSLELALADRSVTIVAGQSAKVDFVVPSGTALRDAVCSGLALGTGRGVVAGHAIDADTEQPLVGATVVVGWNDLTVDRSTLKAKSDEQVASVMTGDRGTFRLCGVPTGTSLTLQLQQGESASAAVKLAVSDEEGAVARELSLSAGAAPTIARLDSVGRVSTGGARIVAQPLLTGTATLVGTVRGVGGQPLPNTDLRVEGAPSSAVSDAAGQFSLSSLPAGSQMLIARHIGYEASSVPVELRAGRPIRRDLQLTHVVSLDSIRVVAMRLQYPEFEYNRRANPFGYFLGPEEIARRKATETIDLLTGVAGVSVRGHGPDAQASSAYGRRVGTGACEGMRVILNGSLQGMRLNDISPSEIAAIELYPQGEFAPTQYSVRGACGVVVVWTKQSRRTGTASEPKKSRAPR